MNRNGLGFSEGAAHIRRLVLLLCSEHVRTDSAGSSM